MHEVVKLLIAAGIGGLVAVNRANVYYRQELVREAVKLRIAELKLKRTRIEAEEDAIIRERIDS